MTQHVRVIRLSWPLLMLALAVVASPAHAQPAQLNLGRQVAALGQAIAAGGAAAVSLSVDEAIERALANSHRLEELDAREGAAAAVIDQRHAVQLPRLNAQGGYTRTNHVEQFGILLPNNQLRIIYPDIPDNVRSRLDAQYPLYTGGRLQALERAARTDASAATFDTQALRTDLKADVARTYWMLVSQTESLRVIDRSIEQVAEHLRDARNRLDAGLVPPNEVLSVEAQQARQQMLRVQMNGTRESTEAALARLVGLPPGTTITTTALVAPEPAVGSASSDGAASPSADAAAVPVFETLLATARDSRSDRRALAERVAAAGIRMLAADAGHKPTVAVVGGFDYARPNPRIFPRAGQWQTSWDATINVDWPVFDGGRVNAELAEATAAQRAAQARLDEFDSLLGLEIRQRLSEWTSSRAAVTAADVAIRAATEAHRVLGDRFKAGVATSTDVLDAEVAILQAQLDRTQALAATRMAEAGLARATGK